MKNIVCPRAHPVKAQRRSVAAYPPRPDPRGGRTSASRPDSASTDAAAPDTIGGG
ncbi:MAG: hypothetical protein SGI73_11355 [Chloroflexota bacterium]|nr:hypothetical protein [Chloroflexota bacterium]